MGEWLRFALCVPLLPMFIIEEFLERRKYEAFKTAQRQRRVDEANGL